MGRGPGLEVWGLEGPLSLGGRLQLAWDESEASDPSGGYLEDEGGKAGAGPRLGRTRLVSLQIQG